jgi:hypothetical protein
VDVAVLPPPPAVCLASVASVQRLVAVLFVKNPTVIALTMLWWVGPARQTLSTEDGQVRGGDPARSRSQRR